MAHSRPSRHLSSLTLLATSVLLAACGGGSAPAGQEVTSSVEVDTSTVYTLEEVAQHADRDDCWTVVDGNVYDLTEYLEQHPGGARRPLAMCGTDASHPYNFQHESSDEASAALAQFQIGVVE